MKQEKRPMVIAHRGASALAPENTLSAARLAHQVGADMWELDVFLTSDDALLVLHDDTLARTTNVKALFPDRKPWRACDFSLAEVQTLDFGSWFNAKDPRGEIAAGVVTPEMQRSYVGEPVLTLEKALLFTREHDWQVNVEIKDLAGFPGDAKIVPMVVRLAQRLRMENQVLVSSFNHEYLKQVKALAPDLKTAALVNLPHPDPAGLLELLAAAAYHPPQAAVEAVDIKILRQHDYMVNVWTVNDPADALRLASEGVSGIITDFTHVMKPILDNLS
jgi:glycerophosphoryl diester phosphodiesterase